MFSAITEGLRSISPFHDTRAEQKGERIDAKIGKIEHKRQVISEAPPILTLGELENEFPIGVNPLLILGAGIVILLLIIN